MKKRLREIFSLKCVIALSLACAAAAIYLIQVRFESRHLQARLNELEQIETNLSEQNRQFMIELTTVTDYPQIFSSATSEHDMILPDADGGSLFNLSQIQLEARVLALEARKSKVELSDD